MSLIVRAGNAPFWRALAALAAVFLMASAAGASVKSKMLYSRGLLELNAGRTDAALDLFNRAVAEDPRDGYALYYRGVARGRLGDSDGAVEDLTAALTVQPTLTRAALELGIALVQKGEYNDAVEFLERARETEELAARASFFLGVCRLRRGEYDRARTLMREAAAGDAQLAISSRYYEGIIAYRQGDRVEALEHFRVVTEKAPDSQIGGESQKLIEALETTARPWDLFAGVGFQYDSNVILGPNATEAQDAAFSAGKGDGRFVFSLGGSYRLVDWERLTLGVGYDFYQSLHFEETELNIQNHGVGLNLGYSTNFFDAGIAARHDFTLKETDKFLESGTVLPWVSIPANEWTETQLSFRFLVNDFFGGLDVDDDGSTRGKADFDVRDAFNYAAGIRQLLDLGAARYLWAGYRFDQEDPIGDDQGSQSFAYDGHQGELGFAWTLPSAYGMEGGYTYRHESYDGASRTPASGPGELPRRHDNVHGVYVLLRIPLPSYFELTAGVFSTFNNSNQQEFDYERLVGTMAVEARL